jgi:hypothetical protein
MVNPTPYGGGAPAVDPYDLLEGGGRSIKFVSKDANGYDLHAPVGTSFTGLISGDLRSSQIIDCETKAPAFWPDGRPKMQVIMDLQTDVREDPDDDGKRALYVKGQMLASFQEAAKATKHLGRVGEGTRVTVTLIELKNVGKGNPQKIYRIDLGPEFVAYVPPEQRQVNSALGYPGAAAPQQQWATPAQPAFPGQVVPAAPQPVQYAQPVQPPQFPAAIQPQGLPQFPQGIQQVQAPQPVAAPQPPQPVAAPVSPALAAVNAIAAQPAAPTAVMSDSNGITQEHLDAYKLLVIDNNVDPQTAVSGLALQLAGGDPAFITALTEAAARAFPPTA